MPKMIINDNNFFFLKLQSALWNFQPECCLIKLLPCILFEKYVNILALELASPGNRHCANCIGFLSLSVGYSTVETQG